MKKLLVLLLIGLVLVGIFTACEGGEAEVPTDPPHKHTFSTEWSFDEKTHWYAADCGHEMQANVATHTDEDNDGVCDLCLYDGDHEHTFAEEWSFDESNHWYAATCNHAVKKDDAPHADANNDSVCDGCAWNYDHEHTYAKEWSHDAENHWFAVTCTHDVEVKGKAAHIDENNDGICDGCAWDYDHTHSYAEEWSHDSENHWKEADCGHAVISENAPHADEDNNGICDGCAWNYDHEHTYQTAEDWTIDDTCHWHAATCGHDVDGIDKAEHVDANDDEACDVCAYDYNHVHTFNKDEWKWDKKAHYHEATCGHAVRADEAAHNDGNNDGICDVCSWNYDHTHAFSEDWTYDKNQHWHGATCNHDVKQDEADHVDSNNDKSCDVCAWDYDHTHTFANQWSIGTETHYYAPTCGCNPQYVKGGEVKHEDKNRDDKCDTCGGFVSLELVVDKAGESAATDQIKNGTIHLSFSGSGYAGDVFYEFGKMYLHMTDHQTYSGNDQLFEYWYQLEDNGSVFAIVQEGGDPFRHMGADSTFMGGYYFSGEFVNYAFNCYGVEELLYQLYGMHLSADHAASCVNYMEHYDAKTNTYSFSFDYQDLPVNVTFTVNDTCAITEMKVVTGTSGQNVIEIKQTLGARDATNPYDPDKILIDSYDIVDSNGNPVKDGDTIHMITGSTYKLDLQVINQLPTTAQSAFDRIQISCSDESAIIAWAGVGGNMIINAQKEGTYTVTFSTVKTTKSITIVVSYPAPSSINAQVYDANGSYGTYKEYTMYFGDVMHFIGGVPSLTDGRYTAEITQNATNASLQDATIEVLREPVAVTAFTPTQTGDYVITITSVADPKVSCELIVHVIEKVDVSDVLSGEWVYTTSWKVTFTPESEGATKGTVVIVDNRKPAAVKTATFAYEYLKDGIQLTFISGDQFNVKLGITADFRVKLGAFTMKRPEA